MNEPEASTPASQLPPEVAAMLDAADRDRDHFLINVDLPSGDRVPVKFSGDFGSTRGMEMLRGVAELAADLPAGLVDGDLKGERIDAVLDRTEATRQWLRKACATDQDRAVLDALHERGYLTLATVASILRTLVSMVAGRPTQPSQPAPDGSPTGGQTSTESADSPVSTPPPFPSPGS
jgi:hypothetical protein